MNANILVQRPAVANRGRIARQRRVVDALIAYLWIAPAVIIIGVFHFVPVLYATYISLFRWGLVQGRFMGLENYERVLSDSEFWNALLITIYYVIGTIPLSLTIGFLVAYLLFQKIAFRGFYRTAFFLPYVTSTVAAAMVFGWLFHGQYGVANYLLGFLGISKQTWLLDSTPTAKLIASYFGLGQLLPEAFYGPSLAMTVVILFAVWHALGFDVIVFMAGLSNIPVEVEEAARLDGAGRWQLLRFVTLPLLSPTLLFLLVTSTIRSFQAFNQIYIMTNGGPLNSTRTLVMLIFQNFYQRTDRVGYATAIAMILFLIILTITVVQLRVGDRRAHYG